MAVGTLIASCVAAIAAVASVAVPLWRARPRLELRWTGGWSADDGGIDFMIRIENVGSSAIHQIDLSVAAPGDTFGPVGNLGRFALQPGQFLDVPARVIRPERVDIGAGELAPTVKVPLTFIAQYGRRTKQFTLPVGQAWPQT